MCVVFIYGLSSVTGFVSRWMRSGLRRQTIRGISSNHLEEHDFFLMGIIFKVFIEFVTILFLLYVLVFWLQGMSDLNSLTRDQTCTPYTGRQSLKHWAASEVPWIFISLEFWLAWEIPKVTNTTLGFLIQCQSITYIIKLTTLNPFWNKKVKKRVLENPIVILIEITAQTNKNNFLWSSIDGFTGSKYYFSVAQYI